MFIKNLLNSKLKLSIFALIIIVLGILVFRFISNNSAVVEEEKTLRKVEISSVYDLSTGSIPLDLVGTVESQSEAIIRSESQGEVKRVNVRVNDDVFAGQILAEIKNSSQYAEVQRAQAVLDSTNASLSKVQGNSSENVDLIRNLIRNAFNTVRDVVLIKTDQFIEDSDTRDPDLSFSVSRFEYKETVEDKRVVVGGILEEWEEKISDLSKLNSISELEDLILYSQEQLVFIEEYLSDTTLALNFSRISGNVSQSTLDKYKSDVSSARNSINSTISSLITTYNSLRSQINFENKGEDVLVAEASVKQSEASLLSAQINLEKTIFRSPITGKVNFISIGQGDIVNNLQEIAQVIGSGELEIVSYITQDEKENVRENDQVLIALNQNGSKSITGVIERIAPAINPNTQKVEVRIKPDTDEGLVNGQTVNLEIIRELQQENIFVISLPIESIKISAEENFVFRVNDENKLEKIIVEIGNVVGEKIIINSGITAEDFIVVDARGLKEGQEINLK